MSRERYRYEGPPGIIKGCRVYLSGGWPNEIDPKAARSNIGGVSGKGLFNSIVASSYRLQINR
jgi:hypothetical protein